MVSPAFIMPKPNFLYGTAWKEERTRDLTLMALRAGCRAIDTANQRKHYVEAAVGEAVAEAVSTGLLRRADLFLQTKFTFVQGQDHRLPYDPSQPFWVQVLQSFATSQEHLGTDVIDSYILHGPCSSYGLTEADHDVWRAMESLHNDHKVRYLGVSNVSLSQLKQLNEFAVVKPTFVQNRCYSSTRWDKGVRDFCVENSLIYQGFSLLTANIQDLSKQKMRDLAKRKDCTIAQLVFRFAQLVGMLPLTGTTDLAHLTSDLQCEAIDLSAEDCALIESIHF
jgi:diketogulonate reductase-like aldo/keto reductase